MMTWLGVLILVVIAGGLVVMWYRRTLLAKDNPDAAEQGLMASLRAMRDKGEISAEEFDAMRRSMVRKAASRHQSDRAEPRTTPMRTDRSAPTRTPDESGPDKSR